MLQSLSTLLYMLWQLFCALSAVSLRIFGISFPRTVLRPKRSIIEEAYEFIGFCQGCVWLSSSFFYWADWLRSFSSFSFCYRFLWLFSFIFTQLLPAVMMVLTITSAIPSPSLSWLMSNVSNSRSELEKACTGCGSNFLYLALFLLYFLDTNNIYSNSKHYQMKKKFWHILFHLVKLFVIFLDILKAVTSNTLLG